MPLCINTSVSGTYRKNQRTIFIGGISFTPGSLGAKLVQRFLDANPTYYASTLQSYPILTPEETGTVAVPRGQRCAQFDGSNDEATGTLVVGSTITFAAWVKITSTSNQTLFHAKGDGAGAGVVLRTNGTSMSWYPNTGTTLVTIPITSIVNTWAHVALVQSGTAWSFYLNGVLVDNNTTVSMQNGGNVFQLGRYTTLTPFAGSMRDIRVYSVAKSPTEIAAIYNQASTPSTIDTTGLLGMWPLQDESGTTAYDVSGNGKHLTLTNITQSTFHAVDSGVTYNYCNWKGHTVANNLLLSSQAFSTSAPWNIYSGGMTFNGNAATAPDGTQTAEVVSWDSGLGTRYMYQTATTVSGAMHTFSVWLRAQSGTVNVGLRFAGTASNVVTATTTWQRFSVTRMAGSSVDVGIDQRVSEGVGVSETGIVEIWGAQLEQGLAPSNYVPTTSSTFSNVIIPASLSAPTQDAAGNALGVTGPVAHPATMEVPCVTGDGSAVYCDLGSALIPPSADFTLSFRYRHSSTMTRVLFEQRTSGTTVNDLGLFANHTTGGSVRLQVNAANAAEVTGLVNGTWYLVQVTRSGSSISLSVGGVAASGSIATSIAQSNAYLFAAKGFAGFFADNLISDLQITTGGVTTYFPLQEGSTTSRDLYYCKSDGTGGKVANAIVNGTIATIRANRCPYAKDWCVQYGGGTDANTAFVPGLIGGANDANGAAKTLSAGKHGNPYSRILPNTWSAPELVNIGYTYSTKLAPTDAVQATSPADTKFRRNKTAGSDRYFATLTALTGSDLSNANSYVG